MIRRTFAALICIALIVLGTARAASRPASLPGPSSSVSAPIDALVSSEPDFPSPLRPTRPPHEVSSPAVVHVHVYGHPWPHAPSCCGPSAAEVRAMITATFGVHAADALAVADCESHDDWQAQNPSSGAAGIFQFIPSHWWDSDAGAYRWNVWDAQTNISAAFAMSSGGTSWSAWSCAP